MRPPAPEAGAPSPAVGASSSFAAIGAESCLLAGGGRALLLQLAEPRVAAAVARHSDFATRPLDRLRGTLEYVYAVALGSPADLAAAVAHVDAAHRHVVAARTERAPAYSARDPRLQLWVAATLADTTLVVHGLVFGPLSVDAAGSVQRESSRLATALQVPDAWWPQTPEAFAAWWEHQLDDLVVSDDARRIADELFAGAGLPWWLRVLMPTVRRVTALLLPPSVRAGYGWSWSPDDERRTARLVRGLARVYRVLPRGVRTLPARRALARIRKRSGSMAARPGLTPRARSGRTPPPPAALGARVVPKVARDDRAEAAPR